MRLADIGWVWEGQGLDPGVDPSVLGIGDGCEFLGLSRANYIFHPNTDFALSRLSWLDEVTCDISKWKFKDSPAGGAEHWVDAAPESLLAEAALVSDLATRFPNITGAFHDDMLGLVRRDGTTPEQYGEIYAAVRSKRDDLKLWSVVYTHEFEAEEWASFAQYMDVVNLWVWNAENLRSLDEYVPQCRELFPGKPLILGFYLRDYPTVAPVPLELVKVECEALLRHVAAGTLDGFNILSANLIDGHLENATWIRDFIRANS